MRSIHVALGIACLSLTGCAAVSGPDKDVIMRLDPVTAQARSAVSIAGPILLSPVRATGSASARRYTYIDPASPREVRLAKTMYWEEPPGVLIEHALRTGLSARLGRAVLSGQGVPGVSTRLNVELERFEELAGTDASASIVLRAEAIDAKTRALLFTGRYCSTHRIAGRSPSDRSVAFEQAANQIMDRLAADIAQGSVNEPAGQC